MSGAELLSWYCIGYVVAFVLGTTFLIIGLSGLGGDHDADHDVSTGNDHGADGSTSTLLDFLGVGKCPLSVVLMTLCFMFVLVGMSIVLTLRTLYLPGPLLGVVAYSAAMIVSFFATGFIARAVGKFLPTNETYVESEAAHVGTTGEAVYTFENGTGFIQVRDQSGTVHEMKALNTEEDQPILAGDTVVVTDYDEANRCLQVQKAPEELEKRA